MGGIRWWKIGGLEVGPWEHRGRTLVGGDGHEAIAGETNDKGFVRLWWKQEAGAQLEELEGYLRGVGLSAERVDRAAAPGQGGRRRG